MAESPVSARRPAHRDPGLIEVVLPAGTPDLDEAWAPVGAAHEVELIGPHLGLSGRITIGYFRRLSDFVNNLTGLLHVRDVRLLRPGSETTAVELPEMWLTPTEITLIAEPRPVTPATGSDLQLRKAAMSVIAITPGHVVTGQVHIAPGGEFARFIESTDPAFIPLTDVTTESHADPRVTSHYGFALLSRRHIVAVSPRPEGGLGRGTGE